MAVLLRIECINQKNIFVPVGHFVALKNFHIVTNCVFQIKMCIYMHILIEIAFNMKGLESVIDHYILNVAWTSLKLFVGDSIMQKKGGRLVYFQRYVL